MTERNREQNRDSEYYTGEHILVCLSSSPSNAKVIRAAARMANAFRARFTAVHVELPGGEGMAEEDALRLRMNQRLAEQLGARAVTLYGGDITRQIAEYARIPAFPRSFWEEAIRSGGFFTECELCGSAYGAGAQAGGLPDSGQLYTAVSPEKHLERLIAAKEQNYLRDTLLMAAILAASTILAYLFRLLGIDEANIVTIYILGVLLIALITEIRYTIFWPRC